MTKAEYHNSRVTHGDCRGRLAPEYQSWRGMKTRCYNTRQRDYKNYGARGITVCDRWLASYENFLADMGRRPSPSHTLDRENNGGNYEPGNCRWATRREQIHNRRPRKDSKAA